MSSCSSPLILPVYWSSASLRLRWRLLSHPPTQQNRSFFFSINSYKQRKKNKTEKAPKFQTTSLSVDDSMLRADMDRKALAITPPLLLLSSFFFHLRYHPFLYNSPLSFSFYFLARQPFYDDGSLLFLTEAHQSFDFFCSHEL